MVLFLPTRNKESGEALPPGDLERADGGLGPSIERAGRKRSGWKGAAALPAWISLGAAILPRRRSHGERGIRVPAALLLLPGLPLAELGRLHRLWPLGLQRHPPLPGRAAVEAEQEDPPPPGVPERGSRELGSGHPSRT